MPNTQHSSTPDPDEALSVTPCSPSDPTPSAAYSDMPSQIEAMVAREVYTETAALRTTLEKAERELSRLFGRTNQYEITNNGTAILTAGRRKLKQ